MSGLTTGSVLILMDWLADDVVDIIYRAIDFSESRQMKISGFVGLDADPEGKICGGYFPRIKQAHSDGSEIPVQT